MAQVNKTVERINKDIRKYGVNIYGDPIFRVVFSDDQVENRKGTFNEFSGPVFLRTVQGIREVQKYPWIKSKWILERWASGEMAYHPDLHTDKNGVYVCIYVFQDAQGNYLPPLLKVCEIIISKLGHKTSNEDLLKEDEKEVDSIAEDLAIQSDEVASKDPKAYRETMSSGWTKPKIGEDSNV